MYVILGTDHGGFVLKEKIKSWLLDLNYEVTDVGAKTLEIEDDYVDYAKSAVETVSSDKDRIVLFCRNGYGMCMTANRFVGIRCGLAFDEVAVAKGRTDDDINCLSIPADYADEEKTKRMIEAFLKTDFSNMEKYARRIKKLDNLFQ